MRKKEKFRLFLEYQQKHHPYVETELHYESPYQLLVAVILSAQCTDKRVNLVTPALFQRFPDPYKLAAAEVEEVFQLIKSISYPNNKSKHLVGMAHRLTTEYNGVIPDSVDDLQTLPGVGRKTANVIASVIYNQPALAVDTHVFRVSARLGLSTRAKTPLETEKQLMKFIPTELVPLAHHWLILHGRYVCTARNPKCQACPYTEWCKYFKKSQSALAQSEKG